MLYWRWFNRSRNPLARLALGVTGLVLLAGMLALGFCAIVAFFVIGGIVALVRALMRAVAPQPAAPSSPAPEVIEGEFVVLSRRQAAIRR